MEEAEPTGLVLPLSQLVIVTEKVEIKTIQIT
jgi:hypothetical protein